MKERPSPERFAAQKVVFQKARRAVSRRCAATVGRLLPLAPVVQQMAARANELHLELTNACNARCVFCPYPQQQRPLAFMPDDVFEKALADFVSEGGGDVSFTPIVGDALLDRKFLARVHRAAAEDRVDGIKLVTNGLLIDRFGADELIASGITELFISTAGFDEAMYLRVYRNRGYQRMRRNVIALLHANRRAGNPVDLTLGLRPDRPLAEVMQDEDLQEILHLDPKIDFTWSYGTAGGRVALPGQEGPARARSLVRRRLSGKKGEPCVSTLNGPIVLADGTVLACSCVAAMDSGEDLSIGHIHQNRLGDIWRSHATRELRASFGSPQLNETCARCDHYRDLEIYRTAEGRRRASDSRRRADGEVVRRRRTVIDRREAVGPGTPTDTDSIGTDLPHPEKR